MSDLPASISKQPVLEPAEDFYRLRREGIGFIEQMASTLWTDYNLHDSGITTLEALCYAITDIAYRTGWDIKDILMLEAAPADSSQPYPDQAFFTARDILTVNPATTDDLRRLLIDHQAVRNAWVVCKKCACDFSYLAWPEKDQVQLGYFAPPASDPEPVSLKGLYDALLELEAEPELGDLNDRKIEYKSTIHDATGAHSITFELRFPDIVLSGGGDQWALFMDSDADFAKANDEHFILTLTQFGLTQSKGLFGDSGTDEAKHDAYLLKNWRNNFYLSFGIKLVKSTGSIDFENATLRIFADSAQAFSSWLDEKGGAAGFKAWFEDKGREVFVQHYRKKALAARAAVSGAKARLHAHRSLDEDYCSVKVVGIEEVAACADVEVKPDADIEWVQARIWFELEQYFNSPVRFHTLRELQEAGIAVEDIFNGPALDSGFIKDDDLDAASLKSVLSISDVLNRLMDIEGVVSVNQLQLTKYDAEGNVVKGAADPGWKDGKPEFSETGRASASWLLFIAPQHQPRLYRNLSRFMFLKNGLPFRPRMDEALDTLNQLRGMASRPKDENAANDLNVPSGSFRNAEDYYPVQYSFPSAYGIGEYGLPPHASDSRRARARQLKAYLMVFEQMLGNALAQLANTAKLFSLDPAIDRTYFVKDFSEALIKGFDEFTDGLDRTALEDMTETTAEFYERRNRFLDHLMARFGEQFSDYALLLNDVSGKQVAQARLIDDKISFLRNYPQISHDRAKAFDYRQTTFSPDNIPGIKKRINLLLGFPDLKFGWPQGNHPVGKFRLEDSHKKIWLEGDITPDVAGPEEAYWLLVRRMTQPDAYKIVKYTLSKDPTHRYHLHLRNAKGNLLADQRFVTKAEAQAMMDELLAWSANERLIVVEHLLLRPKFPGDALYKVCPDGGLACGDADPYSFRLTFVMPGWTTQYTDNLDMRRFAERTIQQETPSHLLGKTCWVGNDGMLENSCDPVVEKMALMEGLTDGGEANPCDCATAVYYAYYEVFHAWAEKNKLDYFHPEAFFLEIENLFDTTPAASDIDCINPATAPWDDIRKLMVGHFQQVAQHGWQFERFEHAWWQWQKCNAEIDWTEERLHERVQAILQANLQTATVQEDAVCSCASTILAQFGKEFYEWMESNLQAGKAYEEIPAFESTSAVGLCGLAVKSEAADAIKEFLEQRYNAYREVSYRLWIVVLLLGKLGNTYPGATLHDCDDGSDHNPVRLGSTALGNYPLRTSIT